ncbi:glycosyltransferase [Hymenobacter sp. ISL-91]|uniref:glycosyltransferase n=1 Tax=Hymenobacter sp. ISL-91 TaxID=2819151 RepID=UPI001BEB71F0|nr:glycosyltransferase [Hymenobacter sp. ISL-91]
MSSYNNAHYIVDTLDSIAKQDYQNIELIVVDDCSTDNSVSIIDLWFSKNDIRYKFIKNEKNLGLCKVTNLLIENSLGEYVSIIASDDLMIFDKISRQVSIMQNESADVGGLYSDAYLVDNSGDILFGRFIQWHRHFFKIPEGYIFEELLEGNFIPIMSMLWRKKCFEVCGRFDEELAYEDYDMLLRVSLKFKFVFSNYPSVKYRVHDANMHKSLQGISGVESNFAIFYKHIGIENGKYDEIIRIKLLAYLVRMYDLKSLKIEKYYKKYRLYFSREIPLEIALSSGLSYYYLTRIKRIFGKFIN